MKSSFFTLTLAALLLTPPVVAAGENFAADIKLWQATAGQAATPPTLSPVTAPGGGAGVTVTATASGPWQGMRLAPPQSPRFEAGMKIRFSIRQAVRKPFCDFAVQPLFVDKTQPLYNFRAPYGEWTKVEIPLQLAAWKLGKGTPKSFGDVRHIAIYPYRALDAKGLNYAIADFEVIGTDGQPLTAPAVAAPAPVAVAPVAVAPVAVAPVAVAPAPATPVAGDARYAALRFWQGAMGQATVAPELKLLDAPCGSAVVATAVAAGKYQGMEIRFPEPVDLNDIGSIRFNFAQNIMPGRAGTGSIILHYEGRNGLLGSFSFGKEAWGEVTVPIDLRSLTALAKQSAPTLGKVTRIAFSLYSNFNTPGQYIGIANLKFTPKNTAAGPIKVVAYTHIAKPTAGDSTGRVLSDGRAVADDQAFYRQYADNPDISFDLGAVYRIDKIALAAVAVPSQNISDFSVYTGNDGKKWTLAAHIANKDASGTVKNYTITGDKLSIVGRYVRIKAERSRTDFPLNIAEVSFEGKIPTDAELAACAATSYDLGPALPPLNAANYFRLDSGAQTLYVCKSNGVAVNYERSGKKIAERIFSRYELNDGKKTISTDSYADKVVSSNIADGVLKLELRNPQLPQLELRVSYFYEHGDLAKKVEVVSGLEHKAIFNTATEIVLPQQLRADGLYETWGAGHDLQHKFAKEIVFDFPADTGAAAIFENPVENLTLLAYRYRYNDRYIQIGSGVLTVAGFGDKRTIFTPTGLVIGDGLFGLDQAGQRVGVETRLAVSDGDLIAAFDRYLALPEVRAFRGALKRADWIKDLRLFITQGWDGLWGNHGQRLVEFFNSMIREGVIEYGSCDSDFYWGDFPTSGEVRNIFGGRMSVEAMRERDRAIHRSVPNVKISQYTWLWSASKYSELYKKHPEWFIVKNAEGKELSFFPGWGINYYRLVGMPESRAEIVRTITGFMDFYQQDIWYLDGGGSPAAIDWANLRIDEPDAWDRVYLEIREKIQKNRPDRAIFFNNPENPLGDFGYLESFGGVMTTNWRDGATWMYKFKLWQRPDKLLNPLYIYWLGGVDQAFRQYAVGTGLGLTFGGDADNRRDAALISAWQQSRWAKLVDADIRPNWRYEPEQTWELMPLSFGDYGWLFIKSHEEKPVSREVSLAIAPLGLQDAARPVYEWELTLKPHKLHQGLLGEPEREANYRQSRWASDFIIAPTYLGEAAYATRFARTFSVQPGELKLYMLTQSPALVYSVDQLRNQLWLPETLGVKVDGVRQGDQLTLTVSSTRPMAEIVTPIPAGKVVGSAVLNGKRLAASTIVAAGTRLALLAVPAGDSRIRVDYVNAPAVAAAPGELTLTAAAPGKPLKIAFAPAADATVILAIEKEGEPVWSAPGAGHEVLIPTGATGGEYRVRAYAPDGRVRAEKTFALAPGRPRVGRFVWLPQLKAVDGTQAVKVDLPERNLKISGSAFNYQPRAGRVDVTPEAATIKIATLPMYDSHWNIVAGALEMDLKRFVKIRLRGNFNFFNFEGPRDGIRGLSAKWDNSECFLGLTFDFADATGQYRTRALAGVGRALAERRGAHPDTWGTKRAPETIGIVSNFALGTEAEEVFWLDLAELGAPENWSGRTWLGAMYNNVTPDRQLEVTVLESRDKLPAGVAANKVFKLKGGAKAELKKFKLPTSAEKIVVDGVGGEAAWNGALTLQEFSQTGNPAGLPPPTVFKLLRSADTLYVLATLAEPKADGFTVDKEGKPWFNDGIELYFRCRDNREAYVHYIFALTGQSHAAKVSRLGVGAPQTRLAVPEFAVKIDGKRAVIEAAIPLRVFGAGAPESRFNLGRNRMNNGQLQAFTLAPGKAYLNFDGAELLWP